MNGLLIAIGIIFLICIVVGGVKGAIRIGISLGATILTMLLMVFATPYVSDAIYKYTPADEAIEDHLVNTFSSGMDYSALLDSDLSGTPLDGLSEEELKSLDLSELETLGISLEDLEGLTGAIPKDTQIKTIESADIPNFLKNALLENNNSEIYKILGVNTFFGYIAAYITKIIINIVSFLVTFLLARIIVRALLAAVDLISELPVLSWVNRLAGAGVGAVFAVVIVWILFLVLTILYTTELGGKCFAQIADSQLLTFLYNANPLLNKLASF
ncbi:MAG: CvpA family protein [Hespellia sp.]|nr:CvpA family protein [Hespellia sp.]